MTKMTKSTPTAPDPRCGYTPEPSATGSTSAASPRFRNTRGAAALLGVSPRTLEKHRVCGGGTTYRKLGTQVLYALDDLDAWVAQAIRI